MKQGDASDSLVRISLSEGLEGVITVTANDSAESNRAVDFLEIGGWIPSSDAEIGSDEISYSVWQPEPGLIMLAILLPATVKHDHREQGTNSLSFKQIGSNGRIHTTPKESETPSTRNNQARIIIPIDPAKVLPDRLERNGLHIDPVTRDVTADGCKLELTRREFDLLYFLASNQRQVFTRSQLIDRIWGWDYSVNESTVTVHICRLRSKLSRIDKEIELIQTIRGIGYRFEPPVNRLLRQQRHIETQAISMRDVRYSI